jgi:hypothetical protein
MAESEFAKWLVTLGVGGVLAGFMFVFYRKDIKQYTELWKAQSERMDSLINVVMLIVKDNTASNVKLITMLEAQERNSIRKDDIEGMINRRFTNDKENSASS